MCQKILRGIPAISVELGKYYAIRLSFQNQKDRSLVTKVILSFEYVRFVIFWSMNTKHYDSFHIFLFFFERTLQKY